MQQVPSCQSHYYMDKARGVYDAGKDTVLKSDLFLNGSGTSKIFFLPSDIKQSYSLGTDAEFMWMELRLPSTTLTYTPAENNAVGFDQSLWSK